MPVRLGQGTELDAITISIPPAHVNRYADDVVVWLVVSGRSHEWAVKHHENQGRTLRNSNLVGGLRRVAKWQGKALETEANVCLVLLQSQFSGRIVGAARLALDQTHREFAAARFR